MKQFLQNISSIQTGIYCKPETSGEIVYLQSKHFDEYGSLTSILYPDVKITDQTKRHLLKHGDVLFSAKGNKNFATRYENKNGSCVASSTFLIIRIKDEYKEKILPEFLVWFLNHPDILKRIKNKAIGSSIPSISKSALSALEVPVPSFNVQQAFVAISNLQITSRKLNERLILLKEKAIQQKMIKIII